MLTIHRCAAASLAILVLGALPPSPTRAQDLAQEKLFFPACAPFAEAYTFDCYHDYEEVTAFLHEAARARPDLASVASIGTSYQGRDLWVVTITDHATGTPGSKPGVWVDGGIDADEVVAVEAALGVVHRLLTSDEPRIRELLRTRTFYVAPNVMPDANELHHRTPIRPRDTSLRPWDDDGDGRLDEDPPEDLDGDGEALLMRKDDPLGDQVVDEDDARILRDRRAGDEGPFYAVYLEGLDNDGDGDYQEDRLGGVDPNRNYPGNWFAEQGGSGPFAGSEAAIRALYDFALAHPNIAASQHFHSSGGVVLRPPSVPDLELPAGDLNLYLDLSRRGLELTGYDLATSVYDWNWPPGSANRRMGQVWRDAEGELHGFPRDDSGDLYGAGSAGESHYPAFGGSIDGMYLTFGVLAFANEIYAMGQDYDEDGTISQAEQLRYNDEELDGYAFREFRPFDHPQLGPVEIGGWRKFGHNNPPPAELAEEVRRNVEFVLMQAELSPLLSVGEIAVEDLSDGVYRVTAAARNVGYQPTELAIRTRQGRAVPVRIELQGVEVLDVRNQRELGTLAGHSARDVSWVVRGRPGDAVTVVLSHPKGGTARAAARLP